MTILIDNKPYQIKPTDQITLTGQEFTEHQLQLDSLKEAYEDERQLNINLNKELPNLRHQLAKAQALNSTLLQQRIKQQTNLTNCTYQLQRTADYSTLADDRINSYKQQALELQAELKQAHALIKQLHTDKYQKELI